MSSSNLEIADINVFTGGSFIFCRLIHSLSNNLYYTTNNPSFDSFIALNISQYILTNIAYIFYIIFCSKDKEL